MNRIYACCRILLADKFISTIAIWISEIKVDRIKFWMKRQIYLCLFLFQIFILLTFHNVLRNIGKCYTEDLFLPWGPNLWLSLFHKFLLWLSTWRRSLARTSTQEEGPETLFLLFHTDACMLFFHLLPWLKWRINYNTKLLNLKSVGYIFLI